jgi:hypothetical protein
MLSHVVANTFATSFQDNRLAPSGILGVSLQQSFVNVAFDISAHYHPLHAVDHLDQPR